MLPLSDHGEDTMPESNSFDEGMDKDSNVSTGDGLSQTGSSQTGTTNDEVKEGLACEETRHVLRMRVFVMLILVATGFALSVTLYYIANEKEIEEFKTEYEGNAELIIESLNRT